MVLNGKQQIHKNVQIDKVLSLVFISCLRFEDNRHAAQLRTDVEWRGHIFLCFSSCLPPHGTFKQRRILQSAKMAAFANQLFANSSRQSTAAALKSVSVHQNRAISETCNLNHNSQQILLLHPQPRPRPRAPPAQTPALVLSEAATREGRLRRFSRASRRSGGRRGTLSEPCRQLVSLNCGSE